VGNVDEFSLSDSHFRHWENHIIDFFVRDVRWEVVGCVFLLPSLSHVLIRLPLPEVKARDVGANG
jgi:hypothetical protein